MFLGGVPQRNTTNSYIHLSSIYPFIFPPTTVLQTYLSNPSISIIHPSIYSSLLSNLFIHPSIYLTTHFPTYLSSPSISIIHPPIHPSTHLYSSIRLYHSSLMYPPHLDNSYVLLPLFLWRLP